LTLTVKDLLLIWSSRKEPHNFAFDNSRDKRMILNVPFSRLGVM